MAKSAQDDLLDTPFGMLDRNRMLKSVQVNQAKLRSPQVDQSVRKGVFAVLKTPIKVLNSSRPRKLAQSNFHQE